MPAGQTVSKVPLELLSVGDPNPMPVRLTIGELTFEAVSIVHS